MHLSCQQRIQTTKPTICPCSYSWLDRYMDSNSCVFCRVIAWKSHHLFIKNGIIDKNCYYVFSHFTLRSITEVSVSSVCVEYMSFLHSPWQRTQGGRTGKWLLFFVSCVSITSETSLGWLYIRKMGNPKLTIWVVHWAYPGSFLASRPACLPSFLPLFFLSFLPFSLTFFFPSFLPLLLLPSN